MPYVDDLRGDLQAYANQMCNAWSNLVVSGTTTGYVTYNASATTSTLDLRTVELAWPEYAGTIATTDLSPITTTRGGVQTTYVALGDLYLTTLADGSQAVVINGQTHPLIAMSEGELIEKRNLDAAQWANQTVGDWLDLIREQDTIFDDGMTDAERFYRGLKDYLYSESKVQRRIQRILDNDEAEFLRRIPETRAEKLLMRHLTDEQRADYHAHGYFYVIGQSGDRYRIRPFGVANVDVMGRDGEVDLRLCCHPGANLPGPDMMLGQKLAIEHDEAEFRRRANTHYRRQHYTVAA